jgi:type IV secretory pathway VirB10-like protein
VGPKASKATGAIAAMESPDHVDLGGVHGKVVRISGRTRWAILGVGAALLAGLAYGGYQRTKKTQAAAREAGLPAAVTPAINAEEEFLKKASAEPLPHLGRVPLPAPATIGAASSVADMAANLPSSCGADPHTGQAFRFDPQTGRPCDLPPLPPMPQERVVIVRQAPSSTAGAPTQQRTEEQQLAAAIAAPTGVRSSSGHAASTSPQWGASDLAGMGSLPATLVGPHSSNHAAPSEPALGDYELQNAQGRKEEFLLKARERQASDYLGATREAPLSRYEIKAGWEIPAILEQALNSDLPGELRALVASNVYDTATGMYLLIPQGSRLLGKYDSRISYGQEAVEVAWNRIIYPDASSVDLDGMLGLDREGNAGLHDRVDPHYRRLLGFSALTSLMTAAYAISQQRRQSVLFAPSPSQTASGAVGEELSRTGSDLTRRNLNVQPTLKVPAGYRFLVRVNKDILFDEPYRPEPADPRAQPRKKGLSERARS